MRRKKEQAEFKTDLKTSKNKSKNEEKAVKITRLPPGPQVEYFARYAFDPRLGKAKNMPVTCTAEFQKRFVIGQTIMNRLEDGIRTARERLADDIRKARESD